MTCDTLGECCERVRDGVLAELDAAGAGAESRDRAEALVLAMARNVRDLSESGRAMDKVAHRAHWSYTMAGDYVPALVEARRESAAEWRWLDEAEEALDEREWRRETVCGGLGGAD